MKNEDEEEERTSVCPSLMTSRKRFSTFEINCLSATFVFSRELRGGRFLRISEDMDGSESLFQAGSRQRVDSQDVQDNAH